MNELDWLAERRPDTVAPDEETTAYARTALLAYAVGGGETRDRPAVARPQSGDHSGRRRPAARRSRAGLYTLAAAVFAIAIGVVAGALPSGDGPAKQIAKSVGAPAAAEAAPLVKLSKRILAAPTPTGDATLVLRSHHFPDAAKDFTGADLYFDDGRYFYGITLDELKQSGADIGEGVPKLEREAAVAANTLPEDQARRKMIDATFGPKGEPSEAEQQASTKEAEKIVRLKRPKGKLPKPASKRMIDDNRVWIGSMDTLIAGAGDPEVRAGVMKLMDTITKVSVVDHGATLDIHNQDFPDYEEVLTVDAKTGVIQKMTGGVPGETPDVVVDYDIKRVTAADVLR